MFERFSRAGIAVAGIDVGESYGSPDGRKLFSALYRELTGKRGFAAKPVLLGRSRGGLMTLDWAAENADKVAGFAGIYPVCDIASYPGVDTASEAYQLTAEELSRSLAEHNPIDRLEPLARAGVPVFAIHGDVDTLVPLDRNSGEMKKRYEALGGQMRLVVPPGQGHNYWEGFFQCRELVDFVIERATTSPSGSLMISSRSFLTSWKGTCSDRPNMKSLTETSKHAGLEQEIRRILNPLTNRATVNSAAVRTMTTRAPVSKCLIA